MYYLEGFQICIIWKDYYVCQPIEAWFPCINYHRHLDLKCVLIVSLIDVYSFDVFETLVAAKKNIFRTRLSSRFDGYSNQNHDVLLYSLGPLKPV